MNAGLMFISKVKIETVDLKMHLELKGLLQLLKEGTPVLGTLLPSQLEVGEPRL